MNPDRQLVSAVAHLTANPHLGPWVVRLPTPVMDRGLNHFHALARSILFQQLSGSAARTIHDRLVTRTTTAPGRARFPSPAVLLSLHDDDFRECGVSRQKATYLRALAAAFESGALRPQALARLEDETVIDQLTRIKGIGVWTAQMFLMFTLRRPDIFPLGDLGIRKGMQKLFRLRKADDQRLVRLAEPWRPYRSYACWYLWRLLDEQ